MKNIPIWITRLTILLVGLELIYLVVANIGLNQQFVKDRINQIRPDRFQAQWENLTSYFPTHISVTAFRANGGTKRNRWRVKGSRASATLDVMALTDRVLKISGGDISNVEFEMNRRSDEEIANYIRKQSAGKRARWSVEASDLVFSGAHKVTLPKGAVSFEGMVSGSLTYQGDTRLLAIDNGQADAAITSLSGIGEVLLANSGSLKGDFEMAPFVPSNHRGKKALNFLQADAEIAIKSGDISFLNPYIERFKGMTLTGKGEIQGKVRFDRGKLSAPTLLHVIGAPLELALLQVRLMGEGTIDLRTESGQSELLIADIHFDELVGFDQESEQVLVKGSDLSIQATTPNLSLLEKPDELTGGSIVATIPKLEVPEIQAYQKYIPDKLRFTLTGGTGYLEGSMSFGLESGSIHLLLTAEEASTEIGQYAFSSGLELKLDLDSPSFVSPNIDLSGTGLRLVNARVKSKLNTEDEGNSPVPFSVELRIENGTAVLPDSSSSNTADRWIEMMRNKQTRKLFEIAEIDASLLGSMSDLRWIEQLVHGGNGFSIRGAGKLSAQVNTVDGNILKGSQLVIVPEDLSVAFLDYQLSGQGNVTAEIIEGGKNPDISLAINFRKGALKRLSDAAEFAHISNAQLLAVSRQVDLDAPIEDSDLHILIPSAKVLDMTVYNSFLPPDSPLSLLSGTADLRADINLGLNRATGQIELETEQLKAAIDQQAVSARLRMFVEIVNGDPGQMRFDISGSKIQLDQISVEADDKTYQSWRDGEWIGELSLKDSRVQWRQPVNLELNADLHLDDTRPFVAILSNHTKKRDWLEKLLSVDNVKGSGKMVLAENRMEFPLVFVDAGDVKMGAKGFIDGKSRQGMVYARYKKLNGLLRLADGRTGFDLLKARSKFDDYVPGNILFSDRRLRQSDLRTNKDTLASGRSSEETSGKRSVEIEADRGH